jgi:hypothetical protein
MRLREMRKKKSQKIRNRKNKKEGKKFEREICKNLYEAGFWVREDFGNQNGQTLDVICARNNFIYIFECKKCKTDYFSRNRLQDNQILSFKRLTETGNSNAFFVFYIESSSEIYVSKEPIKKPSDGIKWDVFVQEELIKIERKGEEKSENNN